MPELKDYFIGALTITILTGLGYNVLQEDTHFCRDLEIGKYCDHLSGTEKTCYPLPDSRVGSKYCSSAWEEIGKEEMPRISTPQTQGIVRYECAVEGCTRLLS